MKRISFIVLLSLFSLCTFSQMSDSQVLQFIQRETKAGTSQAQIATKLMQRGVKMDQIRRLRDQYARRQAAATGNAATSGSTSSSGSRLRQGSGLDQDYSYGSPDSLAAYPSDASQAPSSADSSAYFNGKRVFGRDIFNTRLLSFEPNMNIATPPTYVLGPGDQVFIDVYGASQKTEQLTVSPEGTVTVPGFGPVHVSGLTVSAANARLRSSLGSRYSSSRVQLTVGQTRTILVNVMGEVKTPGTYTLSAFSSVFHALYLAGGTTSIGTLRDIRVFRGGRQVASVDVYDYILNGRLSGNIRLQENDVIVVGPYQCMVDVTGGVKRPMYYEMKPSESVGTLVKYAGGFTGDAYRGSVRVVRKAGSGYSVHTVDEFDLNTFRVADGDSVSVDGLLHRYDNMVEVRGAVFRPGMYELGSGTSTVRSLVERASGVTEDAFTGRAVLHRMRADRTLEVLPVDLGGILAGTAADVPLRNEDVLFVPTQSELQSQRTVTVYGEVLYPGDYVFAANETIEDLILQAGGLTDAASTARVDVSRRIVDPSALTTSREIARTFSFSLKDGFVVDGEPGFTLEPYDEVYVRRSPGYHAPRNMTVEGEVLFGGTFTLSSKNQRLSDVVRQAGGVTDQAYVRGARLERTMTPDERARTQALLRQIRLQQGADTVSVSDLDLSTRYTVGIRLDEALAHPGGDYDVVVREGDRLVVPEYNGTVKVSGNVMFPNTVSYMDGKSYKWYVNQAGGFGHRARKGKTYVIYANGTIAQVGRGTKVEPGCEIVVPTRPKRDATRVTQWLGIGSSVTSMAAMIATIANMVK